MREDFMRRALEMAVVNVRKGLGGPFAALVVRDGNIVGEGTNLVTSAVDPTAHAEIMAIRDACRQLGKFQLTGCDLYTSCEPCPMCLGAVYWARVDRVFYAASQRDAAEAGFDDAFIYREMTLPRSQREIPMGQVLGEDGGRPFAAWELFEGRVEY
ncbi:MAG: nucleoside deaminase [Bacteroidota bacterium]